MSFSILHLYDTAGVRKVGVLTRRMHIQSTDHACMSIIQDFVGSWWVSLKSTSPKCNHHPHECLNKWYTTCYIDTYHTGLDLICSILFATWTVVCNVDRR